MRPVHSALGLLKSSPGTASMIVLCGAAFFACYLYTGTLEQTRWTLTLLRFGALFNPLALDKEWYRMFTHIFLHGSAIHLLTNLYAFAFLGYTLEGRVGTRKFLFVLFVCGLVAAMNGLFWNIFTVGAGLSGAVSGLFGFALVRNLYFSGSKITPMIVLLLHFAGFALVNLLLPEQLYADYAALFGGVIAGIVLGFFSFSKAKRTAPPKVKFEYLMIAFLLIVYFMIPRSQVRYFRFFRDVVAAEDSTRQRYKENLTEDQYMRGYISNYHQWDDVMSKLKSQTNLPVQLSTDTFKLRNYIALRKRENLFRKFVVQREAYIYLDSADRLEKEMKPFMDLEYGLWSRVKLDHRPMVPSLPATTVYYDSNGVEADSVRAVYYRTGYRDSLGRWEGRVSEYYRNGNRKMRGEYKKNKRDGIFLYYYGNGICAEAGRFSDDRKSGKWETFHENGKLASEVYYNNFYFVNSVWDSLGTQLVVDGNGRELQHYPNGVVAVEGEYRHGLREGVWYGRYPNGDLHYEENYVDGRLVSGKSRTPEGETFVYDHTSLLPLPEGGIDSFSVYLKKEAAKVEEEMGHVKLSFRVTKDGQVADLNVDQGASPFLDEKAKHIILAGPRWRPARKYGYEPVEDRAYVQVEFY